MLSTEERERYARQLLLAELGEAGQARLCAARVVPPAAADPRAAAVACDYLERAGLQVVQPAEAAEPISALPDAAAIARLAGDALLEDAAAELAGAYAAVEAIKTAAGVGTAATLSQRCAGYVLQAPHAEDS